MKIFHRYHPRVPKSLVFMLQASEYDTSDFLNWFWRATDLSRVARRGRLDLTAKAKLLLLFTWLLVAILALDVALAVKLALNEPAYWFAAIVIFLAGPYVLAYGLAAATWLGAALVQRPKERAIIARAAQTIQAHPGYRIAIAGSYGKTTMKEILLATLSEGKKVAATPGNMNTPIGISRFAAKLIGDEEILIFELGEYYPGDIEDLCKLVKPQLGVITGINEAHLSKFKTLENTTNTIFELADYLKSAPVYKNGDNGLVTARAGEKDPLLYTEAGVNGWQVSDIKEELTGTSFTVKKGHETVHITSGLLGRYQAGPLVAALDIAVTLGLTPKQAAAGLSRTKPFEHRMQPRHLGGAWIIDDTYNGNRDGVMAGLAWLAAVPAKRRIYVTPGLVEQGEASQEVHEAIGLAVAGVAGVVVLIKNSTTPHIEAGLRAAKFKGELKVVEDPLRFYENVDQVVAAGDVMLMQNDWTDNYE
jgi:UDP-N-acetylmuramoyl-tripeptide--D-alanyl-D-alanine ligase